MLSIYLFILIKYNCYIAEISKSNSVFKKQSRDCDNENNI